MPENARIGAFIQDYIPPDRGDTYTELEPLLYRRVENGYLVKSQRGTEFAIRPNGSRACKTSLSVMKEVDTKQSRMTAERCSSLSHAPQDRLYQMKTLEPRTPYTPPMNNNLGADTVYKNGLGSS